MVICAFAVSLSICFHFPFLTYCRVYMCRTAILASPFIPGCALNKTTLATTAKEKKERVVLRVAEDNVKLGYSCCFRWRFGREGEESAFRTTASVRSSRHTTSAFLWSTGFSCSLRCEGGAAFFDTRSMHRKAAESKHSSAKSKVALFCLAHRDPPSVYPCFSSFLPNFFFFLRISS